MTSSTSRAPTVIVVTGPSGAGKGTLIREVLKRVPGVGATVSATTRDRRPGEEDGREYHFLRLDEFLDRIERGDLLEHVTYVSGRRYGTLRSELDRIRRSGSGSRSRATSWSRRTSSTTSSRTTTWSGPSTSSQN